MPTKVSKNMISRNGYSIADHQAQNTWVPRSLLSWIEFWGFVGSKERERGRKVKKGKE
jgi:hypothetical protein